MKRIAAFEKVSEGRFLADGGKKENYDKIILPVRATAGSAGYDIVTPQDVTLNPGESIRIPTGIRVRMEDGWVFQIYPRSGLGYKYRVQLDNTVWIIDSDYYFSDNEGHIQVKITNYGKEGKTLCLKSGERFCQGIFTEYGITYDDEATATRNGGFGSTGIKAK